MPRHIATVVAVAIVASASVAQAKPKRKVRIETDPPGATVYVGDKKAGAKGKTPLSLDLAPGETTLILELDGYLPHIESVSITPGKGKAGKQAQKFSFALDKAVGTIRMAGLPDGAKVTLDGNEVSTLDDKVEVEPGAHELVVKVDGQDPFDQWVEVSAGEDKRVEVKFGASTDTAIVEHHEAPEEPGKRASHPWYGTAGVSYEAGWRRFRYDNPQTTNLRPFDANGVGMITFWGELAPWRASSGAHAIWPLSIIAGFGVGFPVTASDSSGNTADTFWRTTEVGLRWRWNVTHEAALDFEGGYARLLYTFRDAQNGLIDTIPDVDYQTVRLGLRAVAKIGKGHAWLAGENRIVMSGGEEENRFSGASAQGLGGRLGTDIPFASGRVVLRVEGNLFRYGWTFTSNTGDMYMADGASDVLWGFNVGLGGSY
ncbi:MAG TPA: PEGA domain-containing protein [Kofleriaceae bacterium]|nr:PEGA domain-containing protein [Kofleriaceae bacterium]